MLTVHEGPDRERTKYASTEESKLDETAEVVQNIVPKVHEIGIEYEADEVYFYNTIESIFSDMLFNLSSLMQSFI